MPKRVRTLNCTHVDMDRIYGRDQQCYVCGREPSIGFLYECRQDCSSPSLHSLLSAAGGAETERVDSPLRAELQEMGLSESIIRLAEQGHYTPAQLELLKLQKQDLKQIIEDTIQGTQINDVVARLTAHASTPSNNDGAMNSKPKAKPAACAFRACHTCRPYYRDRVYISFEAVASADFPPISKEEAGHLPTKSADILRSIGGSTISQAIPVKHDEVTLPNSTTITFSPSIDTPHTASTSSDSSEMTFKTTQTDVDELRAIRRPRHRFYKVSHRSSGEIARDLNRVPSLLSRQGLKIAVQAIFHPGRDSSSSGSMITLPVPHTGTVRDATAARPVGEFDLGALRRVRRQREKNELRNGTYVRGFEGVGTPRTAAKQQPTPSPRGSEGEGTCSTDSDFSVYSCISRDSDVQLDDAVALSTEAIVSRASEVVVVDDHISKSAICIRTETVAAEDDRLVGLQGIMAQV